MDRGENNGSSKEGEFIERRNRATTLREALQAKD